MTTQPLPSPPSPDLQNVSEKLSIFWEGGKGGLPLRGKFHEYNLFNIWILSLGSCDICFLSSDKNTCFRNTWRQEHCLVIKYRNILELSSAKLSRVKFESDWICYIFEYLGLIWSSLVWLRW